MKTTKFINRVAKIVLAFCCALGLVAPTAWADSNQNFGFAVSPMNQSIILNPGDTYHGSFKVVNPNSNEQPFTYRIEQRSFYVNEDYETVYDEEDSPIVNWTTIDSGAAGELSPNESAEVMFTIKVPTDAAGAGQYEAFRVMAEPINKSDTSDDAVNIKENFVITHLVFAEVTGNTTRQGEVINAEVPSFLFSGNIKGTSSIKNTGNMHGTAKYTLQVFPLFSNEEVFTNVEDIENSARIVLPNRTYYHETEWAETPSIGIFNVIYTVEFEGTTAEVSKMVIVCPIWLLFIIIFIIALIIIWIIMRVRHHSKSKTRKPTKTPETA